MKTDTMLTALNIEKRFGGHTALDGVNFDVRAGEIHGLLGENGAGKSTLIKILAGAHQLNAGTIMLDGNPVVLRDPKHARDIGIRIVHQELSLVPELTVAENLFLHRFSAGTLAPVGRASLEAEAERLLEECNVDVPANAVAGRLPIGMRQLVEIAREIGRGGKVLILDEPTSSLTAHEIEHLFALLAQMKERGLGIVFVSHRLDEVMRIADRITVLRNGRRVGTAATAEVTPTDIVTMIVGRGIDDLYPKTEAAIGSVLLEADRLTGPGFRDISFTLHAGEILGIAGLIGAGRSELLHSIFGASPINSGTLRFRGRPVHRQRPDKAIAAGLILLPEARGDEGVFPDRSISDNIVIASLSKMASWAGRLIGKRIRAATLDAVSAFGIATRSPFRQAVRELSGGNQQKVIFARLLETNPSVLLLDEPTRGVDVGTKAEIHKIMGSFVARGRGILMVSSDLPELAGACDRILVLRKGAIVGQFDRGSFDEKAILQCAMGVS